MTRYINLFFLFSIFLLAASCGGGSNNSSGYSGTWYNTEQDYYLVVNSDQTVSIRYCTINNGYQENFSGAISGDIITIEGEDYPLTRNSNTLTISVGESQDDITLNLVSTIPDICTNDAIEITNVSPASAQAGQATTFTIDFEYRLTSVSNGIIYLGFNTENASEYILEDNINQEIVQPETSEGSFTATVTPTFHPAPHSFDAYVNLSENPHSTPWTPLASSRYKINVTPIVVNNFTVQSNVVQTGSNCKQTLSKTCQP